MERSVRGLGLVRRQALGSGMVLVLMWIQARGMGWVLGMEPVSKQERVMGWVLGMGRVLGTVMVKVQGMGMGRELGRVRG